MSRTKIYNMMENRIVDLSLLGSNAYDTVIFDNGAGVLGTVTDKFCNETFNLISAPGFAPTNWLEELNSDAEIKNQSFYADCSLDDIWDGDLAAAAPSSNILLDFIETSPVQSPSSISDESDCDITDLLFSACPEEILSSKMESSQVPLAEHGYATTSPSVDESFFSEVNDTALSPASVDSGFSSSEESVMDSPDILLQLLNGAFDFNVSQLDKEEKSNNVEATSVELNAVPESNLKNKSSLLVNDQSSRPGPYKRKQKTPEQKSRKKAQNRTAASRYRSKKGKELEQMFLEADELENKNKELHDKVKGLKSEIDYLKILMLDVIKARLSKGNSITTDLLNKSNTSQLVL